MFVKMAEAESLISIKYNAQPLCFIQEMQGQKRIMRWAPVIFLASMRMELYYDEDSSLQCEPTANM